MGGVSKRELGFLLIGFGIGLLFAVAAVIEYVLWFHHMFMIGFAWRPVRLYSRCRSCS